MIQLLGRATSGNVQKVLFLLEELGLPYERKDYGRQWENTTTPRSPIKGCISSRSVYHSM